MTLPDGSGAPCLTNEQVAALAAVGERVEAHFGVPQDIEWAIDAAGAVWLTQARPITTLYPLPAAGPVVASVEDAQLRVYVNVNVAQGMYRPFTPMGAAALRLIGGWVAELAGRPVPDRRAGPPVLTQGGGRLFVDLTAAVRSRLGRQVVPRIFDVMETRSAVMVRSLFDDPRLSVVYGRGPALRAMPGSPCGAGSPLLLLASWWPRGPPDGTWPRCRPG